MPAAGFKHILCPVDFSERSAQALRYAARLAQCGGARITAVYADLFAPPPYFTESSLDEMDRQVRVARQAAQDHLEKWTRPLAEGAELRVEEALPADGIREAAAAIPADLIVIGTHGRSGFNRLMLGSVTERVLREAHVPVLVVRGEDPAALPRHLLVPVNDSEPARRALVAAVALAGCTGAAITALHVREPQGAAPIENLCSWIPEAARASCEMRELVRHGNAAEQAIAVAREVQADLLVLGAEHRRFADTTSLGANTIRILRHAHVPVLAVFGGLTPPAPKNPPVRP